MKKKKQVLLATLLCGISILAGMYYPQAKEKFLKNRESGVDVGTLLTIPEKGIHSNQLSIDLFLEELEKHQNKHNVFIAPFLAHSVLETLAEISAGDTQKLLQKQLTSLSADYIPLTQPRYDVIPASDYSLPIPDTTPCTVRLPFKENKPKAQSFFNSAFTISLETPYFQLITSENTSEYTRFIVGAAASFQPSWQVPFSANHTIHADFFNDDGAIRRVEMMRCRGMIRCAKAEDESWEAVALFFRPNQEGNTPIAFIGILPTSTCSEMAKALSADMLSIIRTKLARATPQDCLVSLPRIICKTPILSLNKVFEKRGLGSIFMASKADFSPVSTQKIAPDGIFAKYSLELVENKEKTDVDIERAPYQITFDKPFIWIIGDLTTEAPPFYMGLLQNL